MHHKGKNALIWVDKKTNGLKERIWRLENPVKTLLGVAMIMLFIFPEHGVAAQEFIQIPGVIHAHSTFSSGDNTLQSLVSKAKEAGIGVLIPTDHDLVVMEYGLFPLRNLLKKRVEQKSVMKMGPEKYLGAINRINNEQNDVLVIPGIQSSPFYYWTGSPFRGDLTANDYRKELLSIGMMNPQDYLRLPLLHRGFSTNHVKVFIPRLLIFFISLVLGIYVSFQKGRIRFFGIGVGFFSLMLMINHHPFQSSKYDPYHGDQGITPYQELIDYVRKRGGLVFWAHPEARYGENGVKTGPITLKTKPYPEALLESKNYTGFSALYGDWHHAENPGNQWDQALLDYCQGKRSYPVWIIAEADFHKDKSDGGVIDFDTYQTIFLSEKKDMKAILDALSSGKIYTARKGDKGRLSIDRFQVGSKGSDVYANMGEKLNDPLDTEIHIAISATDKASHPIRINVIRGGRILKRLEGNTPYEIKLEDSDKWTGVNYYRLEVEGFGKVLSNPIFVNM